MCMGPSVTPAPAVIGAKRKRDDDCDTTPPGCTVMSIGKHVGKTFEEINRTDPGYCAWALSKEDAYGTLLNLKNYLRSIIRDDEAGTEAGSLPASTTPSGDTVVNFGKFKGNTFEEVRCGHSWYCGWILNQQGATGDMLELQKYLRSRLNDTARIDNSLSFDAWVDDYVDAHVAQGHRGYCFGWLEHGACTGFRCEYKHEYPPSWTEQQRRSHQRRVQYGKERLLFDY